MKIPVVYELNGRRRCLLVQDGETISVGRGGACSIQLAGEAVQEVELTAQFVNGCQFVVVHPANGSVPYAQPLPWKLALAGNELEVLRPFKHEPGVAGKAGREVLVQGLRAGETRLVLPPGQPLLLGSDPGCEVVIPDAGCPEVLLALWAAAGSKVLVQVLNDAAVVGWLGRAGEGEAELELPVSLSIGGRVLVIRSGEAAGGQSPVVKVMAAASPAILAKNAEYAPKIVARQASPSGSEEGGSHPVQKVEQPERPAAQAPIVTSRPQVLPVPTALSKEEGVHIMTMEEAVSSGPKPATPKAFIFFSWVQVVLSFAVVLLPKQGLLSPEQIIQLWYVAGGSLVLTILLGLVVLIK